MVCDRTVVGDEFAGEAVATGGVEVVDEDEQHPATNMSVTMIRAAPIARKGIMIFI